MGLLKKFVNAKKAWGKQVPEKNRRVFKFKTHEAEIHLIRFKGKKRVIRVKGIGFLGKRTARKKFLACKIFHTLFPENSIVPVGVASVKKNGLKHWGSVSEILRGRSSEYKTYPQMFYEPKEEIRESTIHLRARYQKYADKIGEPFAKDLLEKTGISLDDATPNFCIINEKPVFFEIRSINSKKLKEYLKAEVKDEQTRKTVLKLLRKLKSPF